jgi:predicted secreted protein
MRLLWVLIAACAAAASPTARAAETVLRLTETASISVPPDELASSLRAEALAAKAAEAQARVNALAAEAVAAARKVPGVAVSTGAYTVWRVGPTDRDRTERWQAVQSINISGRDGAAVLALIGQLQERGLAASGLSWRLSRDAARAARQDATRLALEGLRRRALEAAETLDLKFDRFASIGLNAEPPIPRPAPMLARAATAAAEAPPPPVAAPENVDVSANAQADAVLVPK